VPSSRWQGQAPRDSLVHPVWEPSIDREPRAEAFVAQCLLAPGVVAGSRRLSMLDLRVWAALCGMLHAQYLCATGEHEPDLHRDDIRTVGTTVYQLADRVWADDGGKSYRLLRRSLFRLGQARITVRTVERDPDVAVETITEDWEPLLGKLSTSTARFELTTPRQWGALKGSTSLQVEIGHWAARQVVTGRCTWLDLDLLRALGPGLASRVWATLEAWARWPHESFDGRQETAIGLGTPALESLGVAGYARRIDARRALDRAGAKIVSVDAAYEAVHCEKRAGWCLVVRRRAGARTRGQLRRQARDAQAERSAVRTAVRRSVAEAAGAQRAA